MTSQHHPTKTLPTLTAASATGPSVTRSPAGVTSRSVLHCPRLHRLKARVWRPGSKGAQPRRLPMGTRGFFVAVWRIARLHVGSFMGVERGEAFGPAGSFAPVRQPRVSAPTRLATGAGCSTVAKEPSMAGHAPRGNRSRTPVSFSLPAAHPHPLSGFDELVAASLRHVLKRAPQPGWTDAQCAQYLHRFTLAGGASTSRPGDATPDTASEVTQ